MPRLALAPPSGHLLHSVKCAVARARHITEDAVVAEARSGARQRLAAVRHDDRVQAAAERLDAMREEVGT